MQKARFTALKVAPAVANFMALGTITNTLTATGATSQANSYPVVDDVSVFTTVAANTGARLPTTSPGDSFVTANYGANSLFIYPPSGGKLNNGSANASISLGTNAALQCDSIDGLNYLARLSSLAPTVSSGTYTPTLFNVANLTASTAYQCQWSRAGSVVTVSGKADIDPTAAGSVQLGISLPVASNIGAAENCAGTAFAPGIAGQGAAILGDATNDRAQMQWVAVDVTNQAMFFTFSFLVI